MSGDRRGSLALAGAVAALLILLGQSSLGLISGLTASPAEAAQSDWARSLAAELGRRLDAARPGGLAEALSRQQRLAGVIELRLLDAAGAQLASAPPRITPSNWGWLAGPAAWLRSQWLALVARPSRLSVEHAGRRLGELQIYQWRGAAWWNAAVLWNGLCALLALAGLLGVSRGPTPVRLAAPVPAAVPAPPSPRLAQRLRPALDALAAGVALIGEDGRLRYLNPAAAALAGWSPEEALGLPAASVFRLEEEEGKAAELAGLDEPAALGEPLECALILRSRAGGRRSMALSLLPLQQRDGTISGALLILREAVGATEQSDWRREADLARRTLDQLADGVAVTDKYGRIVRVNQRLNRMFAYGRDELVGVAIAKLLPVPFLNEASITLHHYVGSSNAKLPRVVGWRKDATTFPVELQVQELYDEDHAFLLLIRDSGERQRRENLSMRLGRLLDYAAEEIYIFDAHSLYFIEANREACANLGYAADQLSRMTPLHLAPGLDRTRFDNDLAALRGGEKRQVVYRTEHRRADGSQYPVSLRLSFSREEEPPVFMALAQDITEQRAAEARLEYLAQHDAMTSLPNRSALLGRLEHLLATPRQDRQLIVYFLDLDNFKQINDQHGHAVGDELLIAVAERLQSLVAERHFAARLAGDEFVVVALLEVAETPADLAAKIRELTRTPVASSAGELQIQLSLGFDSARPEDSAASLLQRADAAMYRAKAAAD